MDGTRGVTVQARDGEEACPYCRERFARGERVLVCEGCQAPYHEECMRHELGRCATLGCGGRRALPRAVGGAAEAPSRPVEATIAIPDRSRCAACQEALRVDEQVLVCASCRAEYHRPCAERTARCSHRGCTSEHARRRVHGDARDRLVLAAFVGAAALALVTGVLLLALFFGEGVDLDVALLVAPGLMSVVLGLAGWCGRAFDRPVRFGAPAPPPSPPAPPTTVPACATCLRLLVRGEPLLECEGCAGQHHPGCLRGAGRCRVAGCAGRRAVPRRAR